MGLVSIKDGVVTIEGGLFVGPYKEGALLLNSDNSVPLNLRNNYVSVAPRKLKDWYYLSKFTLKYLLWASKKGWEETR